MNLIKIQAATFNQLFNDIVLHDISLSEKQKFASGL